MKTMPRSIFRLACAFSLAFVAGSAPAAQQPNIVVMLADDMGFGELSCLNPNRGKIPTPQLDAIARGGMIFTDAHSGSSVCTPTRYGLLTGRYAWRTRLQQGVLQGGPSLVEKHRLTLPKLLKEQGYHTAVIGKWHLGMLFDGRERTGDVPVGAKVSAGPIDAGGFDEFHGFHHAGQMKIWIDNDTVTRHITPIEMLPNLTRQVVAYIESRAGKKQPFFLYVPWNSPHSPVVPSQPWQGKSGLNSHADYVMQTDDSYGKVVQALKDHGLLENTLIICSSDNGTSAPTSHKTELEKRGHYPSGELRGSKSDLWDGGHRVPMIATWPNHIAPGSRTDHLICLTDIFATAADILDVTYPASEGVDSHSFLNTLLGKAGHPRQDVIHHSVSGLFAIRQGPWKLVCAPGSGGWTPPTSSEALQRGLPMLQLYDMQSDLGEQRNLAAERPETVLKLRALLDQHIAAGRSTPGAKQRNNTETIVVDKLKKKTPRSP